GQSRTGALDERCLCRAPRERLDPQRAAAREEIEDGHVAYVAERAEERLPHAVGRGTRGVTPRGDQATTAVLTGDHSHGRVSPWVRLTRRPARLRARRSRRRAGRARARRARDRRAAAGPLARGPARAAPRRRAGR